MDSSQLPELIVRKRQRDENEPACASNEHDVSMAQAIAPTKRRVSAYLPEPKLFQIGAYVVELGPKIGCGGYSTVFSVKDQRTGRTYALKMVHFTPDVEEDIRANLLDEVKTLQKLRNVSHVIQLLASNTSSDEHIEMLMELGQGDLDEILKSFAASKSPIGFDFIRYWGGQMLQAVAQVHAHDIVHADLKPANFVVVSGSLKLIDFGIANPVPKHTVSVHRQTAVGTPMYMAPETTKLIERETGMPSVAGLNNKFSYRVTKASDVWSCGIILYEMVYEKYPYADAREYVELAQADALEPVVHPTHTHHEIAVPLALHEVIRDCLQLDSAKRCTVESAASSLFFSPVSVDLAAVMDIAWAVRSYSLKTLTRSAMVAAASNAKDPTNLESLDNCELKRDRRRRREFERMVAGLYEKLKEVNTGNRYTSPK